MSEEIIVESIKYPHRVLLAVSGLNPQVVTETIYALAHREKDPFVPTEIHIVTTSEGEDRARLSLLGEVTDKGGYLKRMAIDYPKTLGSLEEVECKIHVVMDDDGQPLKDIETDEQNLLAADLIIGTMIDVIEKYGDECQIISSAAGGRKTMGIYQAIALVLTGRDQDEVTHVLVNKGYENHPEFYYTTPYTQIIHDKKKKPLNTQEAQISLSYIPVPKVMKMMGKSIITEKLSFRSLVENSQIAIDGTASLKLYQTGDRLCIYANNQSVLLGPKWTPMLLMFAQDKLDNGEGFFRPLSDEKIPVNKVRNAHLKYQYLVALDRVNSGAGFGLFLDEFGIDEENCVNAINNIYRKHFKREDEATKFLRSLEFPGRMSAKYFDEAVTNIKAAFINALGNEGAKPFLINKEPGQKKPQQLGLSSDQISISIRNDSILIF